MIIIFIFICVNKKQIIMKQIFKSTFAIAIFALSTSAYAGDTYESSKAKCSINFPGDFEVEAKDGDGSKSITVTGITGSMIYMLLVTIYDKPVAEDENNLTEILQLMQFAKNTEAKLKVKKILKFTVGAEQGYYAFIKPKLNETKYQGEYFVVIKDNILYQFTGLGQKKEYDERAANKFADSFRFSD